MIIQAIALLDDLDKELNTYAMRVKEWYGWHFPEMAKIINDNLAYSKVILKMGMRTNAAETDLAEVLPEEIETAIKAAAEVSMGTEITIEDLDNIRSLADQVVEFTEYRASLSSYLSARMQAIAPNLTTLVGELVGARLIAHSGSLINLAKSPASTIQILGAEKALFRALKTKHDTPKYGLIYHASLVGQATGKNKGKIARMLATKTALGLRVDSLADWGTEGEGAKREPSEEEKMAISITNRAKIERRLRQLEGKPLAPRGVGIGPAGQTTQPGKWELKEARKYNAAADGLSKDAPAAAEANDTTSGAEKPSKKAAKLIEEVDDEEDEDSDEDSSDEEDDDEDSDEEMADTTTTTPPAKKSSAPATNGHSSESEDPAAKKAARKAAKEAAKNSKVVDKFDKRKEKFERREERQEKRDAKKDRKVKRLEEEAEKAKEALAKQKAKLEEIEKQANAGIAEASSKKRKHNADEDKVEKKKKRKHEGEDEDKTEKKKKRKSEGAAEEPEKKKKKRQSV